MVIRRTKALAIAAATLLALGLTPVALGQDNVNTQPVSDAATLVRPANLRGLPPDNTLVLVNGKRRHHRVVISFTTGIDLVATYVAAAVRSLDWSLGTTDLNPAYNMTETELVAARDVIDRKQKLEVEGSLPVTRWYLTGVHDTGNWRFLARLSYYDDWTDPSNTPANDITFGDEYVLDVEASYTFNDRYTIVVGAQNVLDEFPDRELNLGYTYPEASPLGFNGGFYYARIRVDL